MKGLTFGLLLIILESCGTTKIITSTGEGDIYIDRVNKNKSEVVIHRIGPPKKQTIYARLNGITYGETQIKRKFDFVTLVAGFYTYGIGFFTCWRYPSTIIIPLPANEHDGQRHEPIWAQPPLIWGATSDQN